MDVKKLLSLICMLALAALLPAAWLISRGLPADNQQYIEKKYEGWNGVLRAWVCSRFTGSANLVRWLNACAAEFEKAHDGVYIEFTPVSAQTMAEWGSSGIRPPEMLFFSPGVLPNAAGLREVDLPENLRGDLAGCADGYALPVAMGGYIWVYNEELCSGAPTAGKGKLISLPDGDGRSFSAAITALLSDAATLSPNATAAPDPGIDLGLPVSAQDAVSDGVERNGDALDHFIEAELPYLCVTQKELARLIQLRDAGRGPNWQCAGGGAAAYTDQILLMGVVNAQDAEGEQRAELAAAFGEMLCGDKSQRRLADVGAFSVTGERIYEGFSAYAPLDAQLNGRRLIAPNAFWDPAAFESEALISARWQGEMSAEDALARLEAQLTLGQN